MKLEDVTPENLSVAMTQAVNEAAPIDVLLFYLRIYHNVQMKDLAELTGMSSGWIYNRLKDFYNRVYIMLHRRSNENPGH